MSSRVGHNQNSFKTKFPDFYSEIGPKEASQISVEVEKLSKAYKIAGVKASSRVKTEPEVIKANNNISFSIERGEVFGLLGPNGAGKTTLVNQLLGLTRPTSGSIIIEGVDVVSYPEQVKAVSAYLPQKGLAFGSVEVWRCLEYTGQLRGLSRTSAQVQAQQIIKELDLAEVAKRAVNTLSGGMQRLVGFAMTLMGQPKLLVLDEPTNELDPVRRQQVWETIRKLNREKGVTCILVTHNVLEAEKVIKRLAVMSEGKIVAIGTPGELKQQLLKGACLDLTLKSSLERESKTENSALSAYQLLQNLFDENALLKDLVTIQEQDNPLHFRVYLPVELADCVIGVLIHKLDKAYIDDFRLALPSLEDVYLHLAGVDKVPQD